jgi:hypothetical protein
LRNSFPPQLLLHVPLFGTSHSSTACLCPWARSVPAAQHLPTPPTPARHHAHARATRSAPPTFRSCTAREPFQSCACPLTRAAWSRRRSVPGLACAVLQPHRAWAALRVCLRRAAPRTRRAVAAPALARSRASTPPVPPASRPALARHPSCSCSGRATRARAANRASSTLHAREPSCLR